MFLLYVDAFGTDRKNLKRADELCKNIKKK
jgi:hypothetical protein